MQFIKTRKVKSPERDVKENAGIDFYIPEDNEDFREALHKKNPDLYFLDELNEGSLLVLLNKRLNFFRDEAIYIAPHKSIIIPTGIKSKFGPELALIANNKSGVATKKQLIFGASVIDCSYQGEWHINLINTSDNYQVVECGTKVVQFIPHVISTDPVEIVDLSEEEFYTEKTSRGEGWQGSTGVK